MKVVSAFVLASTFLVAARIPEEHDHDENEQVHSRHDDHVAHAGEVLHEKGKHHGSEIHDGHGEADDAQRWQREAAHAGDDDHPIKGVGVQLQCSC